MERQASDVIVAHLAAYWSVSKHDASVLALGGAQNEKLITTSRNWLDASG